MLDVVVLLVSELATNAVDHTASGEPGGRFTVRLLVCDHMVRIEVTDEGATLSEPTTVSASRDDEHGRGLAIVQAAAARWGSRTTGPLRTVWAEIR